MFVLLSKQSMWWVKCIRNHVKAPIEVHDKQINKHIIKYLPQIIHACAFSAFSLGAQDYCLALYTKTMPFEQDTYWWYRKNATTEIPKMAHIWKSLNLLIRTKSAETDCLQIKEGLIIM